jgi:hypothetical protein
MTRVPAIAAVLAVLAVTAVGCGGSASSSSKATGGSTTSGAAALSAEAQSAATGDIPDNQVFLTFKNPSAGYSISYPEGWTQKGAGADVTFADKNNVVHIVIDKAGAPTAATVTAELTRLKQGNQSLGFANPAGVNLKAGPAIKATYTTQSKPNTVTGKISELIVDRYELGTAGKRATVDLATPRGVDNVDAYRMMINSFRWQ